MTDKPRAYDLREQTTISYPKYVADVLAELVKRKNVELGGLGTVSKNSFVVWLILEEAKREGVKVDEYKKPQIEEEPED